MYHKLLILLASILLIPVAFGKSNHAIPTNFHPENDFITKRWKGVPFNAIYLNGPMDATITTQGTESQASLNTTRKTFHERVGVRYVAGGGISIARSNSLWQENTPLKAHFNAPHLNKIYFNGIGNLTLHNFSGPLCLTVGGKVNVHIDGTDIDLRSLEVTGRSNVTITGIKSCLLDVYSISCGQINLQGEAVLRSLELYGSGNFCLYWVDSPCLNIIANRRQRIFLAGVAQLLQVRLDGCARLNAKQLRAQYGFINTNNRACAEVWVKRSMATLATGCSNIYFYRDPCFLGQYMKPPGLSLRMVGVSEPSICPEYCAGPCSWTYY